MTLLRFSYNSSAKGRILSHYNITYYVVSSFSHLHHNHAADLFGSPGSPEPGHNPLLSRSQHRLMSSDDFGVGGEGGGGGRTAPGHCCTQIIPAQVSGSSTMGRRRPGSRSNHKSHGSYHHRPPGGGGGGGGGGVATTAGSRLLTLLTKLLTLKLGYFLVTT